MRDVLALLLTTTVLAAPDPAARPPKADAPAAEAAGPARLCETLQCTPSQRAQLRTILAELRDDGQAARDRIRSAEQELARELAEATPDDAALDRIVASIASARATQSELAIDAVVELHALLDATQRARLAEIVRRDGLLGLLPGGGRPGARKR